MPKVDKPQHKDGEFLVDYEEKVFEDVQADGASKVFVEKPGNRSLTTY